MREALSWAEQNWANDINLSYFFNARSPDILEKSSLGLYRSLLHQLLLLEYPSLKREYFVRFQSKVSDEGGVDEWTPAEIQNFLIHIISTQKLPPLNIFIDALDEGEEEDVREMVAFLEEISIRASTSHFPLRVCLSSRHWPFISVERGFSLIVEEQSAHYHVIGLYLQKRLRIDTMLNKNKLREEILSKSAGVFLWVVLVVPMLNQVYDRGGRSKEIFAKLNSIPPSLSELFASILTKSDEGLGECALLLQWVLYAKRPLSPHELCRALGYLDVNTDEEDSLAAVFNSDENSDDWNPEAKFSTLFGIKSSSMPPVGPSERFLLYCSRGLVELTKSTPRVVQFIHETVGGYLRDSATAISLPNVGQKLAENVFDFELGTCSAVIAQGCLQYLLALCEKGIRYASAELLFIFPLAEYAAKFWWQHAKSADITERPELMDLAMRLIMGHDF